MDSEGAQGRKRAEAEDKPHARSHRGIGSLRWLLNLQHSTALLGEPGRCVPIGDQESDIYELFCAARDTGSHFLVRSCANRRAGDGTTGLESEMEEVRAKGAHRIEVRDSKGEPTEVVLELRYRRMRLLPPVAK